MNEWLTVALSMATLTLGHWMGRASQRDRHVEEQRSRAYSDYLRAVAACAHLHLPDNSDYVEALKNAADAKARIAVYGSSAVIESLARFVGVGESLIDDKNRATFVRLIAHMRVGKASKALVSDQDLWTVLMGTAPYPR
jgi:hypothetical protein